MKMTAQTAIIKVMVLALLACMASLPTRSAAQDKPTTVQAKPGISVVHVGNSHSHPLRILDILAPMAGHGGHKNGEVNILGAPLRWNWDHPEQNKWQKTLAPDSQWDAITLLAWGSDDKVYAPKFAAEAFKGNPKCQVYIYTIWPDAHMDFEKPDPIRSEAHTEAIAAALAEAFPDAPKPRVIPSSLLIRELGRLADRGELARVASRFELFSDGGHLSEYGHYAINVLLCAMLYNESPLSYPADVFRAGRDGKPVRGIWASLTVPQETADVIKQTVWDILLTYPPTGMKSGLIITDRRLPPVIAGQPYKVQLKALNAAGACTWSLARGQLPAGLALSSGGVLSGQTTAVGKSALTIKVSDGISAFERPITLVVNEDKPPAIPEQPIVGAPLDRYVFHSVAVRDGVGHLTLSISDGKLPYGIMLSPAGILIGSPGEQGQFAFKVKVEDSNPAGPHSAERAFTWTIGPATPEALLVASVGSQDVTVDGKLEEAFWKLDQSIARKTAGTPAKSATFGAVWVKEQRKPGVGSALLLAVKVLDGPKGKTPRDGVHVFIDGRHNREVIYNADDTHFYCPRAIRGEWATSIKGKPNWFTKVKVSEFEGAYTMEIHLSSNYFVGEGSWLPFGRKGVYGFDIAVDEGDKEVSQQVWRGTEKDAEDTSGFGTIVLTDEAATPAGAK